jgi:HAE1 family hydrophobic/amphiphilic exporter-1
MRKKIAEKLLVLIKSAIVLQIVKQSDANAVAVEQLVKTIATLENDYKSNELNFKLQR